MDSKLLPVTKNGFRRALHVITSLSWRKILICLLAAGAILGIVVMAWGIDYIYFDRSDMPDMQSFVRFDLPTVGHIYDVSDQPLTEMAAQYRQIVKYDGIPPVVRDAILATEDKNFFSHEGIDYAGFARVLYKIRFRNLLARFTKLGGRDAVNSAAIFPQGGSTITQQLVRGFFLKTMAAEENSNQLQHGQFLAQGLTYLVGARTVNMLFRKLEEVRLSLWLEEKMTLQYGSKRLAKEEILARYASVIYMGNGQYGFERGANYYFDRPLATFTVRDVDKAALLAGIIKSPRNYSPDATQTQKIIQRRNQILELMAAREFISHEQAKAACLRPIETVSRQAGKAAGVAAVVENVLDELKTRHPDLNENDLLQGRIQIYSTVNARMQQIANQALEHGLSLYEKRHPRAAGLIQGSVVVLSNSDASILAETGGRQAYKSHSRTYRDFNRVTKAMRQPGSAMKPILYLAAFRKGIFDLDTAVPDEPISVRDGGIDSFKWISNYDGRFKGRISIRRALAESRNAAAIWLANQIGIESVVETAHNLGIQSTLNVFVSTALGASEVNLLELGNAYRTIATGTHSEPFVIRKVVLNTGEVRDHVGPGLSPIDFEPDAIALIQEGLRSNVRMPSGTAHSLDSRDLPFAVMGKTGTTNEFKDALFVGSTYGIEGITVAVRIGFDDARSLGASETGGRVALPVFREIMLHAYGEKLVPPAPSFPVDMEQRISASLKNNSVKADSLNLDLTHKMGVD